MKELQYLTVLAVSGSKVLASRSHQPICRNVSCLSRSKILVQARWLYISLLGDWFPTIRYLYLCAKNRILSL